MIQKLVDATINKYNALSGKMLHLQASCQPMKVVCLFLNIVTNTLHVAILIEIEKVYASPICKVDHVEKGDRNQFLPLQKIHVHFIFLFFSILFKCQGWRKVLLWKKDKIPRQRFHNSRYMFLSDQQSFRGKNNVKCNRCHLTFEPEFNRLFRSADYGNLGSHPH